MDFSLDGTQNVLQRAVNEGWVPGASLAFVTQNSTRFLHAGYSALVPQKVPLAEDAIYDLASLTKVVATTTAALQCLEAGYFSLHTPVADLLLGYPHGEVTVRHLLCHTAGYAADDAAYKTLGGKEDMRAFVYQKPLSYAPGTQVLYSDFSFILLGFVLEALVGDLNAYTQAAVFGPLGMRDTGYLPRQKNLGLRCVPTEETPVRGLVQGEVHDGKAYMMGGVSGNAGLFSTAGDLALFARMLLGGGALNGARVLAASSIKLLHRCYTPGLAERRTLGWIADDDNASFGDYARAPCLFHTGFTGTSLYVDFARHCAVVLLTNRIHPSRDNPCIFPLRHLVHNQLLLAFDTAQQAE